MSLTLATWNVGNRDDRAVRVGLTMLSARQVDVIGLQECGDRWGLLPDWAAENGYEVRRWGVGFPGADSVPILVRGRARRRRVREAVEGGREVGRGAGPSRAKAKVVQVARVDLDDWPLAVLNTHMVASATRLGHRQRKAHYEDHIEVVAQMARRQIERRGRVVVLGDMNAPPDFRGLDPLREVGLHNQVHQPTHGRRCIDHIWTHGLQVTERLVIKMPSDHDAALVIVGRRAA